MSSWQVGLLKFSRWLSRWSGPVTLKELEVWPVSYWFRPEQYRSSRVAAYWQVPQGSPGGRWFRVLDGPVFRLGFRDGLVILLFWSLPLTDHGLPPHVRDDLEGVRVFSQYRAGDRVVPLGFDHVILRGQALFGQPFHPRVVRLEVFFGSLLGDGFAEHVDVRRLKSFGAVLYGEDDSIRDGVLEVRIDQALLVLRNVHHLHAEGGDDSLLDWFFGLGFGWGHGIFLV